MSTHDPQIWAEARQRMPLPALLDALDDARFKEKKSECPFCGLKPGARGAHGGWSLFKKAGRDFFKCHNPECTAHDPDAGNSEIGYLALRKGMPAKEAAKEYLRMAFPERAGEFDAQAEARVEQAHGRRGKAGGTGGSPPHPAPVGPPKNVWEDLHRRLPLTSEDHDTLMRKRGFSPETIALHGIRSNKLAYKPILEALAEDYPLSLLLAEGIYKEEGRAAPGPIGQFYGYGITHEKDEHGRSVFALTEPPIIPYFDRDGTAYYLRPHKGGVKKPKGELTDVQIFEEEDDEATCAAEVFIPLGTAELVALNDGRCILTEGEFKALAGAQCGVPIIAVPGIAMVRNPEFRRKLEAALEALEVSDLIIIFDNEVKDDPAFPKRYKPDPWKQCDTEVYAEYTMRELRGHFARNGGSIRVGLLPEALRIEGKADFDGILARCVADEGLEKGTKAARKIFRQAMDDASHAPGADLFPSAKRRIIECKVERLFHVPRMPIGGNREMALARRFTQYDPETNRPIDKELADAMESSIGCYYLRKKPERDDRHFLSKQIGSDEITNAEGEIITAKSGLKGRIADLEKQLADAERAKLADPNLIAFPAGVSGPQIRTKLKLLYGQLAAKWERLKGVPTPISTFTMSCEYKLHTPAGIVERLVKITRRRSGRTSTEKKSRIIGPKDCSRLADFREWCYGIGDANFGGSGGGGDKDLQDLMIDMDHHSYLRDIHELDTYGLHTDSGIWFNGDCAFPPNGSVIHADKNGIFWHEGTGYQFPPPSGDDAAEAFCQGAPLLLSSHDRASKAGNLAWVKSMRTALAEDVRGHREALTMADAMLNETAPADCQALIDATPPSSHARLRRALSAGILSQAGEDLFNTIGDYDGWTILGMMLAYAIGPELCRQGGHPGLWFTGKKSSGKTTIGRWIMRIWGFKELPGIKIGGKSSTAVGLGRGLTQYSSQPILLDEYRADTVEDAIEQMLRGAFDRSGGLKGIADGSKKTKNPTAKTTPLVMGESSSRDSATRSRFVQIHVTKNNRIGDGAARYTRVQNDCKHWFHLGRWLMENRAAFAASALERLGEWNLSPTVRQQIPDERDRLRPGIAFACYYAAAELLGLTCGQQLTEFHTFLLSHGKQEAQDVDEESFISRFWKDVITGRQAGKIDRKFFALKWVILAPEDGVLRIVADGAILRQPVTEAIRVCYLAYLNVHGAYCAYVKSMDGLKPIGDTDVRRHLQREPYYIPNPKRKGETVHRVRMGGTNTTCMVISLERQPAEREDQPEEERPFLFPHAEDLINVLTPLKDSAADSET